MTHSSMVNDNILWYMSDDGQRSSALGLTKDPTEFVVFFRPGGGAMKFYTHSREDAMEYVSTGKQPQWLRDNPQAWILL